MENNRVAANADQLIELGWSRASVLAEAARIEASQFRTQPFTEQEFGAMLDAPGGLCVLLFPTDSIQPDQGIGVAACKEQRGRDGVSAHQLVTIAVDPAFTGQGLAALLDERCEEFALAHSYALRILRSRAPSAVYRQLGGRAGGSPHGEATRFALKRGFQAMPEDIARNFFEKDIGKPHLLDVAVGHTTLNNVLVVESPPQGNDPPWYFIPMRKQLI